MPVSAKAEAFSELTGSPHPLPCNLPPKYYPAKLLSMISTENSLNYVRAFLLFLGPVPLSESPFLFYLFMETFQVSVNHFGSILRRLSEVKPIEIELII